MQARRVCSSLAFSNARCARCVLHATQTPAGKGLGNKVIHLGCSLGSFVLRVGS